MRVDISDANARVMARMLEGVNQLNRSFHSGIVTARSFIMLFQALF